MKTGDKMITLKIILIIITIYIDIKLNQNKYVTNFTYLDIISILLNIVLDIILIKGEINMDTVKVLENEKNGERGADSFS